MSLLLLAGGEVSFSAEFVVLVTGAELAAGSGC
jgi:hypothetical protein